MTAPWYRSFNLWLAAIVAFALLLRLKGIHDPILDHPAWRQGDTASIARNFFRLNFNLLYPQTNYNGPPPNYVELELQIVPYLAAMLYKVFGVHEIFGRLISIAFSLGTVATVGLFARWLFTSGIAGLTAAAMFAVFPGSVYYGRTFTPDTTMVFFLTAALYVTARLIVEDEAFGQRSLARATALLSLAYLAKPVAVVGVVPVIGALVQRVRAGRTMRPTAMLVLLAVPFIILYLYDTSVSSHAEWHWASGITKLHVLPALHAAVTSASGFAKQWSGFVAGLGMLRDTMLGSVAFFAAIVAIIVLRWTPMRSGVVLWGWLAGGLAYAFAVIPVEPVDYYLYLLLPPAALAIGGAASTFARYVRQADVPRSVQSVALALVPALIVAVCLQGRATAAPYYAYSKALFRNAVALRAALTPGSLVVLGHYGPDVLYYLDRYGWEEDPALWTPFDEESAIRKGARYFISVEDNRLRRNAELCAFLQRFPQLHDVSEWPVYQTDPAREVPHALAFWNAFRDAERHGRGRAYLDAHHVCETTTAAAVGTPRSPTSASEP